MGNEGCEGDEYKVEDFRECGNSRAWDVLDVGELGELPTKLLSKTRRSGVG